jgi:hypothetical protein
MWLGVCEYCGRQALTAIADLTREHDEVVALISRARTSRGTGDIAEMAAVARRSPQCSAHTTIEEQGLFPPWRMSSPTTSPS